MGGSGPDALAAAGHHDSSLSMKLRHICLEYPYAQLEAATAGFDDSRRIGAGMAGTVYRGTMPDGSDIAVKVINLAAKGDDSLIAGFEEEVAILSKYRHPNLVVLQGWGREGTRRFLIYEFLPGGDVFQRLQKSKDQRCIFTWHERLGVAIDAASGLAHLHGLTPHAFHRDIKCANILLANTGTAKMADFGLSCAAEARDIQCEFPSGTPGYTCPSYAKTALVTEGSEVHAFGMVLLELLLNQMPAGMVHGNLVYPIQEAVRPGTPGALQRCVALADPTARWPVGPATEIANLALRCIDAEDARRPRFNEVCLILRGLQEKCGHMGPMLYHPPPPAAAGCPGAGPPGGMPLLQGNFPGPGGHHPDFQHAMAGAGVNPFAMGGAACGHALAGHPPPALATGAVGGGGGGHGHAIGPYPSHPPHQGAGEAPWRPQAMGQQQPGQPPLPSGKKKSSKSFLVEQKGLGTLLPAAHGSTASPEVTPEERTPRQRVRRSVSKSPRHASTILTAGGGSSTPQPPPPPAGGHPGGTSFPQERDTRWACPDCDEVNRVERSKCHNCGRLQPEWVREPERVAGSLALGSVATRVENVSLPEWPAGAEVILEVVHHVYGVATVAPEFRSLVVPSTVDAVGKSTVLVGRHCQHQWFEAVLADAVHRNSVSRTAFEIAWGGSQLCDGAGDGAMAPEPHSTARRPTLRVVGNGIFAVDGTHIAKDHTAALQVGSQLQFILHTSGDPVTLLALEITCIRSSAASSEERNEEGQRSYPVTMQLGVRTPTPVRQQNVQQQPPPPPPAADSAPPPAAVLPAPPPEALGSGNTEAWRLECVFSAGISPESFIMLASGSRMLSFTLQRGGAPVVLGRHYQTGVLEGLLIEQKELMAFISRQHLQFDAEASSNGLRVTNLSQNITILNDGQRLQHAETASMCTGDTLSFAAHSEMVPGVESISIAGGDGVEVSVAPFLTFRLLPVSLLGVPHAVGAITKKQQQEQHLPAKLCGV